MNISKIKESFRRNVESARSRRQQTIAPEEAHIAIEIYSTKELKHRPLGGEARDIAVLLGFKVIAIVVETTRRVY